MDGLSTFWYALHVNTVWLFSMEARVCKKEMVFPFFKCVGPGNIPRASIADMVKGPLRIVLLTFQRMFMDPFASHCKVTLVPSRTVIGDW